MRTLTRQQVLEAIQARPGLTRRGLATLFGVSMYSINCHTCRLRDENLVHNKPIPGAPGNRLERTWHPGPEPVFDLAAAVNSIWQLADRCAHG